MLYSHYLMAFHGSCTSGSRTRGVSRIAIRVHNRCYLALGHVQQSIPVVVRELHDVERRLHASSFTPLKRYILHIAANTLSSNVSLKKNLNASRPSERALVRGDSVKTFWWDHRLQIQNLFRAFKWVPRWY